MFNYVFQTDLSDYATLISSIRPLSDGETGQSKAGSKL